MFKKLLLYFALLLWFVVPSEAQPTIFFPEITAEKGEEITVEVSAKDMGNVFAAQFPIVYDPEILSFIEADTLMLPLKTQGEGWDTSHFGFAKVDLGIIKFLWIDPLFSGVPFQDSALLFSLKFEVIGEPSSSTLLHAPDSVDNIEIGDFNGPYDTVFFQNGIITVNNTTSTEVVQSQSVSLFQNYPNPFDAQTVIPFALRTANDLNLSIFDMKGASVFTHQQHYTAGSHNITINHHDLPETGTYWYEIRIGDEVLSKQMIKVK